MKRKIWDRNRCTSGNVRKRLLPVLGIFLLAGCTSPIHFHNEKSATLATQLQTDFAAYREEQPSLYTTLAANAAAFDAEEDAILAGFTQNYQTALTSALPLLNWLHIRKEIGSTTKILKGLEEELIFKAKVSRERRSEASSELDTIKDAIKDLKKEIGAAKKQSDAWEKMISNFQSAISSLPDKLELLNSASVASGLVSGAFEQTKSQILSGAENGFIGNIVNTILPIPEELLSTLGSQAADAPGITVRILELGLELAELEREKRAFEIAHLKELETVYVDFGIGSAIARKLMNDVKDDLDIRPCQPPATVCNESVSHYLITESLRIKEKSPDAVAILGAQSKLFNALLAPRQIASANILAAQLEAQMKVRFARIDHQKSIQLSAFGDRAWQALISSGLDSLVAYHKGGITEDDIANLIRIAQSIALFVIAA